jgi:hypothetical protein
MEAVDSLRLSDSGWKFYIESRYNYAWNSRIHTALIPVTFGLRFNWQHFAALSSLWDTVSGT